MQVFWIVVGVVAVILFIINQNRTKTSDRTVVRQHRTIKTEDGEISIERVQVVDSATTKYHPSGNAPDVSSPSKYDHPVIEPSHNKNITTTKEINPPQPKPFSARLPNGVSQRPAYHGKFPGDEVIKLKTVPVPAPAPAPAPVPAPAPAPAEVKVIEGLKQCTRCRINLPYDKFRKSSKNADGLTIWCASCLDGPRNTRHMKWCPMCNVRRKRTSFYPNKQNADGLMAWCKTCWDGHKARR
ncbi:hypothetical protein [Superficieibacter electus]|uniref:hypothetical protein n=1 Tax=Superficieibacter electus TaxID=2022662 RepID=UPI00159ECDB1|nr:hypothetical protein [Superficieibacter electus]